jgi:hypothetical protein
MNHRYDPDYPAQDYDTRRDDRRRQEEAQQREDSQRHAQRGRPEEGYYGAGRARPNRDPDYPYGYPNGDRRFLGARPEHEYDPYSPLVGRVPEDRRPPREGWERPREWREGDRSMERGEASNSRPAGVRGASREQVWGDPNSGYLYVTGGLSSPGGLSGTNGEYDRWGSQNDEHGAGGNYGPARPIRSLGRSGSAGHFGSSGHSGSSEQSGSSGRSGSPGHSGKGPKGYTRSDDRIREDVCDRLSDDDEVDASDITVTVSNAEVKLEGTVSDRYSKHRAEDIVESVSGVRDIANHLRTRKTFFQEIGDKLAGDEKSEHQGHAGSGTHNLPIPKTGFSAQH